MKQKAYLPPLVLLIVLAILSISPLAAAPAEPEEIVIGTFGEWYLEGVLVEVLERVGKKLNVRFSIKQIPKERSLVEANEGRIGGDGYRIKAFHELTQGKYPNLIRVDEPYVSTHYAAFVTNPKISLSRWEDLRKGGYKVSVIGGNKKVEARLAEYVDEKNRDLSRNYDSAFKKLDAGRIDVLMIAWSEGLLYLNKYKNVRMAGKLETIDLYLYLNSKYSTLVPEIEKEIRAMRKDGTLEKIEKQVRKK